MTAPTPAWQMVTVHGTFRDTNGDPLHGQVKFTPTVRATDTTNKIIVLATTLTATLDDNGHFDISLPATDDPDITPQGFTYKVEEVITGRAVSTYNIEVPRSTPVGGLDLATTSPAQPIMPVATYVTAQQVNAMILAAGIGSGGPIDGPAATPSLRTLGTGGQQAAAGTAPAAAISAHLAASDPHAQYLTAAEGNAAYDVIGAASSAVNTHAAGSDPHPVYLTQTEGDGRYTQLTDSRLTNARTPTAHKATHATGGSDLLLPSDIGASATGHTHSYLDRATADTLYAVIDHTHRASDIGVADLRPPSTSAPTTNLVANVTAYIDNS